jgi:hypothetical protein
VILKEKNLAMENFDTLSQAIDVLRKQGYVEDFNLKQNCLECRQGQFKIFHDEFEIDKVYRFDVMTDPDDQSILYAISSDKYRLKGLLVNAYGIYSDPLADEMIEKLRHH